MQETRCGFDSGVGKIPCRRKWQPTPVCLPGKSQGGRSLEGYSPWGYKELGKTGAYAHTHTKKGLRARALGLRQEGMLLFHRQSPSFDIWILRGRKKKSSLVLDDFIPLLTQTSHVWICFICLSIQKIHCNRKEITALVLQIDYSVKQPKSGDFPDLWTPWIDNGSSWGSRFVGWELFPMQTLSNSSCTLYWGVFTCVYECEWTDTIVLP